MIIYMYINIPRDGFGAMPAPRSKHFLPLPLKKKSNINNRNLFKYFNVYSFAYYKPFLKKNSNQN